MPGDDLPDDGDEPEAHTRPSFPPTGRCGGCQQDANPTLASLITSPRAMGWWPRLT